MKKSFFCIDQRYASTSEDLFWLAFRVVAKGFWYYQNELSKIPELEKLGIPNFHARATEQWHTTSRDIGLGYLKEFDRILNSGDFESISHIHNTYEDPNLRIASGSAIAIEFGELPIVINIFPLDESRTKVVLSLPAEQRDRFIARYLFFRDEDVAGQREQQVWLSKNSLLNAHNLYFSPSYWGGFPEGKKLDIISYVNCQHNLLERYNTVDTDIFCENIFVQHSSLPYIVTQSYF